MKSFLLKKQCVLFVMFFFLSGCTTTRSTLTALQKQSVETNTIEGSYKNVFDATRTVFLNEGLILDQVSLESGFLRGTFEIKPKNPALAAGLGILPGGGSFYTGMIGLGVLDFLLWPFSIIWDPPAAAARACFIVKTVPVTASFVNLENAVEVRLTCPLLEKKAETYGMSLKRIFAEIKRQVLILETAGRE